MKDVTGVVSRQGNIDSKGARKGSISKKGMGVVMQILSQMYTNAPLAVLREYCCNARDSHVAVGNTAPIEVTLPSALQPTLLIQDHGLGLTEEEALTFFLEYGESTKRDSNDQVGAFGIGSKSAFTMGHQFVVTAIKDGRKAVILLSLDENSVCQADVIKSGETTEPNGVLISLAVEDVDQMRATAAFFFSFWERGTVLVDGEEPTPVWEGKTEINDHTWLLPEHEGQVIVAMGGVPYVLGRDILRKVARDLVEAGSPAAEQAQALVDWYSSTSLLFKVPIGDVHIAPNREGLRDTKRSLETIKGLLTDLVTDIGASIQAKVDAAPSPWHAARVLTTALEEIEPFKVARKLITYTGQSLKVEVKVPLTTFFLAHKTWRSSSPMVVASEKDYTVDASRMAHTLVVTGVSEEESGKVRRYAKRFLEQYSEGGIFFKWILVTEEAQGEVEWFQWGQGDNGVRTMTIEEYRAALRTLRDSNPRTKSEPSYTTGFFEASRDLDDRDLLSDIMSWGKDLVLFESSARYCDAMTRDALKDYTVVVLLATQSENMLRKRVAEDGSVAICETPVPDLVKAHAMKIARSITPAERAAMGAAKWLSDNYSARHDWKILEQAFGAENITSKTYQEVMDAYALAELVAADIKDDRKRVLAEVAKHCGTAVQYETFDFKVPKVREVYGLVGHLIDRVGSYSIRRSTPELQAEALEYVNAR